VSAEALAKAVGSWPMKKPAYALYELVLQPGAALAAKVEYLNVFY
jgi:hypothetical protein